MGKSVWGLTLDTSESVVLLNKKSPAIGFNLTPRRNPLKSSMYHGGAAASPPSPVVAGDENSHRKVVDEVDFFSTSKSNDGQRNQIVVKKENIDVNTGLHLTVSDQSSVEDGIIEDKRAKNEMAILQVELEQLNTENQRLRGMLSQVSNNYSTLQTHFVTLMQQHQQQQNLKNENIQEHDEKVDYQNRHVHDSTMVPRQFIELGRSAEEPTSHDTSSEEKTQSGSALHATELPKNCDGIGKRIGREDTPDSDGWMPNKVPKLNAPRSVEQATEATMRKARVSVRARSEAPMITDGCQWRKYGQKMAKGNPCPRAYYRCTMSVGCPVRKQVQRCADDRTILITTYEGTHNHPLPPAAMAMASTTAAAATMLLSGSMSSADNMMNPNVLARTILPSSSSIATISASAPFPTVTLDLTNTPNPFQRPNNSIQYQSPPSQSFPSSMSALPLHAFSQRGGDVTHYNQSRFAGLQLPHDMQLNQLLHNQTTPQQPHTSFADSVSAATAAITADPNFTAALVAAISSFMGGNTTTPTTTNSYNHKTNNFQGN